jgi:RecB family endonuclease NucS
MRNLKNLSRAELEFIVSNVQGRLWFDMKDDKEFWNPNKEDYAENILESISSVLECKGLKPMTEGEQEEPEHVSLGCEIGCDESDNPCIDCHHFPKPKKSNG